MKKFVEDFEKLLKDYENRAGEDVACVMLISDGKGGHNNVRGRLDTLGQMIGRLIVRHHALSKQTLDYVAEFAAQRAKNSDKNLN